MEDGDPDALSLWKRFRDISIERYISTYARLNITFDECSEESTAPSETIENVEKITAPARWVLPLSGIEAARRPIFFETLQLFLEWVSKYNFDKMIYVVSSEQYSYFQRVFKTIELMGYPDIATKLVYVNLGKAPRNVFQAQNREATKRYSG
ncbi:hypothetical protein ACJ72_05438 [Emergomyces africanus]|uniref:Uncharacterized protein n=1 Tax=Emergomyces africanus TaxID=1955775 RepID=A0A1B7NTY1_9EURO|nr:hypothetical protein ACJ72_05438 [Emergomyces africanus]